MLPDANRVLNTLIGEGLSDSDEMVATMRLVMRVTVVVPTGTDPTVPGARLQPIMIDHESGPCMVVYTSGDAASKVGDRAPFAVTMTGESAARGLGTGIGLAVDTGTAAMVIPARDIARTLAELDAQ